MDNEILTLSDIGSITEEQQLLMAALAIITTECRTCKTPDEVIEELHGLRKKMF